MRARAQENALRSERAMARAARLVGFHSSEQPFKSVATLCAIGSGITVFGSPGASLRPLEAERFPKMRADAGISTCRPKCPRALLMPFPKLELILASKHWRRAAMERRFLRLSIIENMRRCLRVRHELTTEIAF